MTQTMLPPQQTGQAQPVYEISPQDKKRQETIANAWKGYNDELDKPLIPMPGDPDDNVMSNRCQPIVDAGVDFLFGKELEISIEGGAPKEAQNFLNDAWGRKEVRIPLLQEWAMNGGNAGEAFLRIVPYNDGTFEIVNIDPNTVYVQTAPQNCKRVLLFCIQYSTMEKINGQQKEVFYREEIAANYPKTANGIQPRNPTSWTIQHWTQIGATNMQPRNTGWVAEGEPIEWDYPFAPIFGNQNLPMPNEYWGKPDITKGIVALNNSLNLVNSNSARVLKIYGAPILTATGVGESQLDVQPGKVTILGSGESKITAVPITSDLASAKVFADDLCTYIDEISKTPGVATGRLKDLPRGAVSGVTVELLHGPLIKKTDTKQCLYGKSIIDISKALLTLGNFSGDIEITLAWQSALPHDDLASLQAAVLKMQIGISETTIQREQGYDPEEELELSQAEDAQKLLAFSQGQGMPPRGIPGMQSQQQESPFMTGASGGQP